MFSAETYDELLGSAPADRLVVLVRCDSAESIGKGSRSERVLLRVSVVAGGEGRGASSLQLTRYVQADPLLRSGTLYLVAAVMGEWKPAWSLLQWQEVTEDEAGEVLRSAQDGLAARSRR